MCDALEILGIRAYHFRELFPNFKNGHYSYWKDALERKYYGLEAQYSKAEFDKILQGYTVSHYTFNTKGGIGFSPDGWVF